MDLRKITLVACVMMVPQSLWAVYHLVSSWEYLPTHWIWVTTELASFLIGVSFPALLLVLYASGILLPVSGKQRYLAAALALIMCVRILYSFPSIWRRNLHRDWQNVERATNYVRDLGWWTWLEIPEIQALVWDALNLLASVAFLLFVLALGAADGGQPGRIRPKAVQAAKFIAVFGVLFALGLDLYEGTTSVNGFGGPIQYLRYLLPGLPALIAPLIVYTGIRTYQHEATAANVEA